MDYLLPDDKTIKLMNEEYSKLGIKNASIFACDAPPAKSASVFARTSFNQTLVFSLYIMIFLL